MNAIATFEIIGRVASIQTFEKLTRITTASNYRVKDDKGEWTDDTHWNQVVIFSEKRRAYIAEKIGKGDLVRVTGRLRQSRYIKDGETIFTTDLVALDFGLLAKPGAAATEPQEEAA